MSFKNESSPCQTCGKRYIGRGLHCQEHRPRKEYRCIECGDKFNYSAETRGRKICIKCKPKRKSPNS